MQIKLNCYDHTWLFKTTIENITNSDDLRFIEEINWWQGDFDIELWLKFDNQDYSVWDLIEYIIYNDDYKNWLHKYSWFVSWIERHLSKEDWQTITLLVSWIKWLLERQDSNWNDLYTVNKTYNWALNTVIDEVITDFHSLYNITNEMDYLWTNILKNTITDTTPVNIPVDWNIFDSIKEIFESISKDFFIDKSWNIKLVSDITKQHTLTLNSNISDITINQDWETTIELSDYWYDIEAWSKIVENVPNFLELENEIIKRVDFDLLTISISLWKVLKFTKIVS